MDFGEVVRAMKEDPDKRFTRTGWNGEEQWIQIQNPDGDSKMTLPYIFIRTVQGDRIPWLASQADILMDDWVECRKATIATWFKGFDPVDRPSHYCEGRNYEPIKVIADWNLNYNLGNALKYISRAGRKGDYIQDLEKALYYLQAEIDAHPQPKETRTLTTEDFGIGDAKGAIGQLDLRTSFESQLNDFIEEEIKRALK